MNKYELDTKEYSQHASSVLAWLQTINRTSKQSPRQPLEQQLQALTLSYKNAQEKLLTLEKQIYLQSMLTEKQRSVIEILKYIIKGSLDDDTILSYLFQLESEQSGQEDAKYEIKADLQQIRDLVQKRKAQVKKVESMKSATISDLKKQLTKSNQIKRQLMQDLDRTLSEKTSIESILEQTKSTLQLTLQHQSKLEQDLREALYTRDSLELMNNDQQKEITLKQQTIKEYAKNIQAAKSQIKNLYKDIQGQIDLGKCVKFLIGKLEKYRNSTKQMGLKLKSKSNQIQLISILMNTLPEEGHKIAQKYLINGQNYLLKEVEAIIKLQRKKYAQMETCQEEMWRLKERILRDTSTRRDKILSTTSNKQNQDINAKQSSKISQFGFAQNSPISDC